MSRTRLGAAAGVVLVLAGAALVAGLSFGGGDTDAPASTVAGATATVERRDLVVREEVDGTLGYGDERIATATAAGRVTTMPEAGTVRKPGEVLYRIDGKPVLLLDGTRPAWRRLAEGVANDADVRQLEANLVALGYDPSRTIAVDGRFTVATRAAVERLQRALDVEPTGALELGAVEFLQGTRRVSAVTATIGSTVAAGAEVMKTTSTRRTVTVELDPSKQSYVSAKQKVDVVLPSGESVQGTITDVGTVATAEANEDGSPGTPTVDVSVALPGQGNGLDQAPVTVMIATETRRGVLAIPVTALAVQPGGKYALEVVRDDGTRGLVPVTTGTFADGFVEVSGAGVRAGLRVVDASE